MPEQKLQRLDHDERALLGSADLLAGLPDALIGRLVKEPVPLNLDKGTILFHQGHPAADVFVVLRGWVRLFRVGETGTEAIIRVAGAGDVFGDDDLLLHQGRQTCAETLSPARLLTLDGHKLALHMRRDPVVALRVATSLAAQNQCLMQHVEDIKLLDAVQRTAHFLLGLCPRQNGACSLSLPYEKAVIAGWLGMKPASFSRALARLRKFGVTVDRDAISILDTRRLAELIQLKPSP